MGLAALVAACSAEDPVRISADEVTEIDVADAPESVINIIMATQPGFQPEEIQRKVRGDRRYYDVEGELPNGEEIEFDVLMTDAGPQIVEIQRDIGLSEVPPAIRAIVDEANADGQTIARIIESIQTDKAIIYEVFVKGYPSDPKFEVWAKDGDAKLLPTRWKH